MGVDDLYDDGGGGSGSDSKKKERGKTSRAVSSAGQSLNKWGVQSLQDQARDAGERSAQNTSQAPRYMDVPSFNRGGTMKKSGRAKLHKNETIGRSKKKRGRSSGRY